MVKRFVIEYREWEKDGKAHWCDIYDYEQNYYQSLTLKDVKEFVKEQRYKEHKPICTCFLSIYRASDSGNYIIECDEYSDSTLLDDTVFNENNPIKVCASEEKKCKCGQLEKLIMSSNFEKAIEEQNKRWEEKERQNREYYERRIWEQQNYHRNEINRLQNLINQQQNQNKQNMENQNRQHQLEIERIQKENNRRENEFIEERRINQEKFKDIERQRTLERKEYSERIQTIENERTIERQENNKKFVNLEQERNREREVNSKRFNLLENNLREKEEQLRKNTEILKENEKQKKYQEKCQHDAENEFLTQINKIYGYYFEKNKQIVCKEINTIINKLINEKIIFENINEDSIYKIVKNEKFISIIRDYFDDKIASLNDGYSAINISSFNIIIIGNTGVGKSTLLNTVLKEKLAKTDSCDACTMGVPKPYESQKAKGIRIWDSRGIENGKYNLDTAFTDIKNTIESLIKKNDPDKFIHCIWYCICSNRFTEEELNNLEKCYDSYIEKLPIIVVFTQSHNQKSTDQMIEKVRNKLEKARNLNGFDEKPKNDIIILKVLAENYEHDFGVVQSFGIHNLMEQTYESGKIGIERACTHSLMEHGQEMLNNEFKDTIKKLKEKIYGNNTVKKENEINNQNQQNNLLKNILNDEEKRKNQLNINNIGNFDFINFINFCKIISREITKKLLLKDAISEETIVEIDGVIETESRKLNQFFEDVFSSQLETLSNKLTEELVDFVAQLENKYHISSLSSKYHYNVLKNQSKNNITKNFKPIIEDIIYREASKIFYQKFSEKVSKELLDCFHELVKNNKRIREIFTSKGKEISLSCLKKIRSSIDYPNDEYEKRNPKIQEKKKSKYEDLNNEDD